MPRRKNLNDLMRVYQDLEKTLKDLKAQGSRRIPFESSLSQIDIRKLIRQLSASKRRLELKIGNTLLLEKQHLKRRLKTLASHLHQKGSET